MRAEELAVVAGVLLSVICSYVPGVAEAFAKLDPTHKRLVMLGLLVVSTVAVFGISCLGLPAGDQAQAAAIVCSQAGVWGLLKAFGLAVMANQATFEISPSSPLSRSGSTTIANDLSSSTPLSPSESTAIANNLSSSTPLSPSESTAIANDLSSSTPLSILCSSKWRGAGGEA